MESGHSLHYRGNTVNIPHPGHKRLKKNWSVRLGGIVLTNRRVKYVSKICATYKCVWCSYEPKINEPIVICPRCRNCQYCGQRQGSGFDHECVKCGNHLP